MLEIVGISLLLQIPTSDNTVNNEGMKYIRDKKKEKHAEGRAFIGKTKM
jgi:hypothetical protein